MDPISNSRTFQQPRRTRRVLLLLGNYYLENHRGIARHAREAHWVLDTSYMRTGFVDASVGKVDGIIGLITRPRDLEAFKQFKNVPLVDLSGAWGTEALPDQSGGQVPRVLCDNAAIGRRAAQHFIVRGFKHIALFNLGNFYFERERRTAFETEIRQAGRVVYEIEYHRWVEEAVQGAPSGMEGRLRRRFVRELQKLPKPLGIFCPADEIGVRLLHACEDADLRVPEEVAVLGCHNDELTCNFTLMPLSSVDDDLGLQGYEAARLLERLMNGESVPTTPILIPPKGVITRASTDILAVPHREVAKALRFIWQHYTEPIQTNDVAAAAGLSRHHLMRQFQAHIGRSISDEILRKRVEHAKRLLVETDLKAWQIAEASGFSSIVHLSSAFSRLVGQAPSHFRNQHQGERSVLDPETPLRHVDGFATDRPISAKPLIQGMNRILPALLVFTFACLAPFLAAHAETPAELANPTIDTIRPRIDFFASASVPFGMVALHPDTHHKSAQLWNSGYRYGDKRILFFTHSHMVQTPGVSTMPVTGPCRGNLGIDANSSAFSHDDEVVRPGYHKVKLLDSGITAELTATNRVGMPRNTFPVSDLLAGGYFKGKVPKDIEFQPNKFKSILSRTRYPL